MTGEKTLRTALIGLVLFSFGACSKRANSPASSSSSPAASIKAFVGRWDLTIKTPAKELPSWIEVSDQKGQPKILMVGLSGHATELGKIGISNGEIVFLSPKGQEGFHEDTFFKGKLVGGRLEGTATGPNGVSWQWTGQRAPTLKREGAPKWGKPVRLFNGRNFDGWRFRDPSRSAVWRVEHGMLVKDGRGSELISRSKFEDFKLHLEFQCGPMSNSGVYLRGRYEVQIETDSAREPDTHHTGAVYGFLAPTPELPRVSGKWQSFDITLLGRTLTVVQNGQTVIDRQEIPGITGGALDSHEGLPGPIYLQGSEQGHVAFRNIVLTPAIGPQ
ncbi:MAG TPA: DUF1080 domain-containing protein [Terriglobia bacterium]|nr:DUF1080 domain-containing protein [Terriglobia bacterium]